jgi:ATP-dependent RNA helicase RhlE
VHRIGRTARAGAEGVAISFCDMEEIAYLRAIEKVIRQPIPGDDSHAFHDAATAAQRNSPHAKPPKLQRGGQGRNNGGGGGQQRQGQGQGQNRGSSSQPGRGRSGSGGQGRPRATRAA